MVVLAYHALTDASDDPVLMKYSVPAPLFEEQLDTLSSHGWRFVSLDDVLRVLRGEGRLPRRAVFLTFDDGYADLLTVARPLLAERSIPATVFAVSGSVGGTNEWDRAIGARSHELIGVDGLRELAASGIEVGSHSVSHRRLTSLAPDELEEELVRSADELEALGLPRPRAFAYPFGGWTNEIADATRRAGYEAAFTIDAGAVRPGKAPHALPRVLVHSYDTSTRLLLKVAAARRSDFSRRVAWRLLRAY